MKEMCLNFNEIGFFITLPDGEVNDYPRFHDKDSLLRAIDLMKDMAIYYENSIYLSRREMFFKRDPTLAYSIDRFILVQEGQIEYTFHFTKVFPYSYLIDVNCLLDIIDDFSKKYIS